MAGDQVWYDVEAAQRLIQEVADSEHTEAVPTEHGGVPDVRSGQPEVVGDVVGPRVESLL